MDPNALSDAASGSIASYGTWLRKLDQQDAFLALGLVVVIVLLRKPLAAGCARVVRWVMASLSITFADEVDAEIEAFLRVLLVAGSLLLAQDVLAPPELAGGFLRRLLISVLVLGLFAAWYRLVDPMIALINPRKLNVVAVDTSWIVRLGQFVVVLMSITALLSVWEIDISSALTGVGVLGAGLAIASQDFIRNLVAGMNNMSEKRFETGDWIAVDGIVEGTVTRVDVRSTTIMGFDHVPHYVPNSELSNAIVLNKSRMDHRRIFWTVGLVLASSDAQVDTFCNAVRKYMQESGEFVVSEGVPLIVCPVAISDHSIDIRIQGFTVSKEYQIYLETCGRLVSALRRSMRDAGTKLAYPTQTIHLSGEPVSQTAPEAPNDVQ